MKFDKDITKIKRVTFLRHSVYILYFCLTRHKWSRLSESVLPFKNDPLVRCICCTCISSAGTAWDGFMQSRDRWGKRTCQWWRRWWRQQPIPRVNVSDVVVNYHSEQCDRGTRQVLPKYRQRAVVSGVVAARGGTNPSGKFWAVQKLSENFFLSGNFRLKCKISAKAPHLGENKGQD